MADEAKRLLEQRHAQTPEVIAGPEPLPRFRRSPLPELDRTTKKWVAIITGAITVAGGCTATVAEVYKQVGPAGELEKVRAELAEMTKRQGKLQKLHAAHLKSCTSFQRAVGAWARKNPHGEVILEGVDQTTARVHSESLQPPVSRVKERVSPLPSAPSD